jgi:hypothetical protein
MYRSSLFVLVLVAGGLLLLPGLSRAQLVPSFTLKGVVTGKEVVELTWTEPQDTLTHTYSVWRGVLSAPANVDTTVALTQIRSTTDTTANDTPHISAISYFLYVVKTTNAQSQTIRSSYAVVEVKPPADKVEITSVPPARGRVGILYTYQVAAVSSDSTAKLKFRLLLAPGNMTIDSATGLVQWTPAARGYKDVSLEVISSKGGRTLQNFSVSVGAGNGEVTGVVHDSATGKIVRYVFIRMYETDVNFHLGYFAMTDSTGTYTIKNVDPGSYFIHAYPFNPNLLPEWYINARFRFGAKEVIVADSPAVSTVNFSLLTDSVHLPIYRAQGTVTDTLGKALRGALVVWARAEFGLNGSVFDRSDSTRDEDSREAFDPNNSLPGSDFNMDDASRWVYRAFTDSLGKYSLRIPKGFYIVRASRKGYYKLFYNNETNILQSDIVALRSDTTKIDFSLTPRPPLPLGEISGMVSDTVSDRGVSARVIAYREWWSAHDPIPYHRHYVSDTDSLGNYDLTDLPPGVYRVLAMPLGQYVPSWYTGTGNLTVHWRQAKRIIINGNDVANADINVRPLLRSNSGYTSITGTVTSSLAPDAPAGLGKAGAGGFAVPGALVYASDAAGQIAGYGLTDAAGGYTITGLAPGSYSVIMDGHDYLSASATGVSPTYDAGGIALPVAQNINTTTDITSVQEPASGSLPVTYTLDQNYPNPFNPSTQIRFSLPVASGVHLTVYNVLGQEISTLMNGVVPAGQHVVVWDGRNNAGAPVSSGVYFYRLQANSGSATFSSVRKMLLLK